MSTASAIPSAPIDTLPQQLFSAADSVLDWGTCLATLGEVLASEAGWIAAVYYPLEPQPAPQLVLADDGGAVVTLLDEELWHTVAAARQAGGTVCRPSGQAMGTHLVATPLPRCQTPGGTLVALYEGERTGSLAVVRSLELAAAVLAQWQRIHIAADQLASPSAAAASVALLTRLARAASLPEAGKQLVNQLCERLQCWQVGLAICRRGRCRLIAVSGLAEVDRRAPLTQAYELALEQAVAEGRDICHAAAETSRHTGDAIEQLTSSVGATAARMVPLRSAEGEIVAACGLLSDHPLEEDEAASALLESAAGWLGPLLQTRQQAEWLGHLRARWQWVRQRRRRLLAGVCLVTALLFALPWPYSVRCQCEVQPAKRRLVVAPFEGTLANAFVEPGDVVVEGQVLARLDERELRMELSGLEAEFLREQKQRDTARAEQNVAGAQMAQLETERIHHRVALLEHRVENLEIRSPVAGVIVNGDLSEVEGSPLEIGQALYEISPLQAMRVEVEVPEHDVAHVAPEMPVHIALEAYPRRTWQGTVRTLHPQAELREQQNVFVAVVELTNDGDLLRPGMRGRAKITSQRHCLAWNWLHRPWEILLWKLGI